MTKRGLKHLEGEVAIKDSAAGDHLEYAVYAGLIITAQNTSLIIIVSFSITLQLHELAPSRNKRWSLAWGPTRDSASSLTESILGLNMIQLRFCL